MSLFAQIVVDAEARRRAQARDVLHLLFVKNYPFILLKILF